jgi:inner membrane protein
MSDTTPAGEPPPPPLPRPLLPLPGWARNPLLRKALALGLLGLLFLLPIGLLTELVQERASRQWQVDQEIAQLWGPPQTLAGPLLLVPVVEASGGRSVIMVLPEELTVEGALKPALRRRGLFETLVYDATLSVAARFRAPMAESMGLQARQVLWAEARLLVSATDLAGIDGAIAVSLDDGGEARLRPATLLRLAGALEAPLTGVQPGLATAVAFTLTLNGSQAFAIAPVGESTRITLTSAWPHPSFGGAGLPDQSAIGPEGFTATWNASAFAEGLPPVSRISAYEVSQGGALGGFQNAALAVGLVEPVDAYLMSERAVKYAVFVLALTFAAVFLFEAAGRTRLHPVQYLLVGAAETLFYLLLLSLTEALGFAPAYVLASAGTVVLIALYLGRALGWRRGLRLGGGLAAVKLYLYVTLSSEDFALLSGSLALFLLLAAVMLGTRKVEWYRAP